MTEEQALLRAICSDPDNDLPRLVYADWLDEKSKPERAEFIRLQIESFNSPGADTVREILNSRSDDCLAEAQAKLDSNYRILELFKNFGSVWFDHLPGQYRSTVGSNRVETAEGWKFEINRGFVHSMTCDQWEFTGVCSQCRDFTQSDIYGMAVPCLRCDRIPVYDVHLEHLFAREPIQKVELPTIEVSFESQAEYETNLERYLITRGMRRTQVLEERPQRCWFNIRNLQPILWKSNRISQGRHNEVAITFLSRKDAMDALSLAAVELGREKAGITLVISDG